MATAKKKTLHELGGSTDKSWAHQYLHVYEALFEPIRSKATTVLEIGIFDGGSIAMWRDYFPKAKVHGMDVDNRLTPDFDMDRITIHIGDAYTPESVQALSEHTFDVMVDDGPHTFASQQFFVHHYSRLLSENGILVVEDIPYPEWIPMLADAVPEELRPYMYAIDRRIAPNRQSINDELMFVIDKRFI